MDAVSNWFRMHVLTWLEPPKQIEVIDIIQVALIAYFVYHFILWLKKYQSIYPAEGNSSDRDLCSDRESPEYGCDHLAVQQSQRGGDHGG